MYSRKIVSIEEIVKALDSKAKSSKEDKQRTLDEKSATKRVFKIYNL